MIVISCYNSCLLQNLKGKTIKYSCACAHIHTFTHTHAHTHTHTHTHAHTHTHRDNQGFRGGALGGCFFSSEENLITIISTHVAADIMNWAFPTKFCMFKVNKSEFNVMVVITSHLVEAFKK